MTDGRGAKDLLVSTFGDPEESRVEFEAEFGEMITTELESVTEHAVDQLIQTLHVMGGDVHKVLDDDKLIAAISVGISSSVYMTAQTMRRHAPSLVINSGKSSPNTKESN